MIKLLDDASRKLQWSIWHLPRLRSSAVFFRCLDQFITATNAQVLRPVWGHTSLKWQRTYTSIIKENDCNRDEEGKHTVKSDRNKHSGKGETRSIRILQSFPLTLGSLPMYQCRFNGQRFQLSLSIWTLVLWPHGPPHCTSRFATSVGTAVRYW